MKQITEGNTPTKKGENKLVESRIADRSSQLEYINVFFIILKHVLSACLQKQSS